MLQGTNDVKTFKNPVVSSYASCSQQNIRMLQKNGSHLTVVFKNHDLVLCIVRSEVIKLCVLGYQVICVRSFLFAKGQQAFEIKPVNTTSQDHPGS